jgi:hypothetical protein
MWWPGLTKRRGIAPRRPSLPPSLSLSLSLFFDESAWFGNLEDANRVGRLRWREGVGPSRQVQGDGGGTRDPLGGEVTATDPSKLRGQLTLPPVSHTPQTASEPEPAPEAANAAADAAADADAAAPAADAAAPVADAAAPDAAAPEASTAENGVAPPAPLAMPSAGAMPSADEATLRKAFMKAVAEGRGVHSSASQLNLSRLYTLNTL